MAGRSNAATANLCGWVLGGCVLGGCVLAFPAMAAEGDPPGCLHSGQWHAIGEIVCIETCPTPPRLARCEMFLNNTTWTYVSDSCPSAGIVAPDAIDRLTRFLAPMPRGDVAANGAGPATMQRVASTAEVPSCAG